MIAFLLFTVLWVIAVSGFSKLAHYSIQQDQWLGGWQNILRKIDDSRFSALSKPLGYCEMCFAHLIAFISYWVFISSAPSIISEYPIHGIWLNIVWYFFYISITTLFNVYVIVKLLK